MIHRLAEREGACVDVFMPSESQVARIEPFLLLAHEISRVDDRHVLSRIVCVIRNGLQWEDTPKAYGPNKTLYNRFIRWSRLGVFDRIFIALIEQAGRSKAPDDRCHTSHSAPDIGIHAQKGAFSPPYRADKGRPELKTPCRVRWPGPVEAERSALKRRQILAFGHSASQPLSSATGS
ncbi:UNVERIFIED_CONTAM: transposase [Acetobacter peroxydans]|nr:transposase [Acetobacter peroxydans]